MEIGGLEGSIDQGRGGVARILKYEETQDLVLKDETIQSADPLKNLPLDGDHYHCTSPSSEEEGLLLSSAASTPTPSSPPSPRQDYNAVRLGIPKPLSIAGALSPLRNISYP